MNRLGGTRLPFIDIFVEIAELYFHIFFFFSSRRRHTRFDCDWSSDVCSSDLGVPGFEDTTLQALTKVIALMPPRLRRRMGALQTQTEGMAWAGGPVLDPAVLTRSEERRVGKECRARWSREH